MSVETIPALFLNAVNVHDKSDAFQYKRDGRYVAISHRHALELVDHVSRGLGALALARGDRVAILSENCFEWVVADQAILAVGCVNVPIYCTLPANQIEYILRDCEARAIFVSTEEQVAKIESIRAHLPNLMHVIVFDDTAAGDTHLTLGAVAERGAAVEDQPPYEKRIATIGKNDWASIIYTSGTTGDPKGVILTHWNFISNALGALEGFELTDADRCLSFLPLSHVLERTGGYYVMLHAGATIAYAESVETVPQNLIEVAPTVMVSVPRLYEKMHARILDAVNAGSHLKKSLFHWALDVGETFVKQKIDDRLTGGTRLKYKLADRLVFRTLKARTGGKLRFFISGGAPLSRDIAEFFYAAGLPVLEGYGLTESSPVITVNTLDHFRFGTVGRAIAGVDIRIAEDGEILCRGPNVMVGYYKRPDVTSTVLREGWLYTGDIGYLDEDGFLTITDRKRDIIVTAGGKNVAPQPIENLLKTSKYVSQAVLIGDRRKFVSAIIVPDFEAVRTFADAAGIAYSSDSDLAKNTNVIEKFHEEIERLSQHLASFERIKKFVLAESDFTIEGNELTPTLKVKRRTIEQKFKSEIDALYAS